jgi:hypothetical protein
MTEQLERQVISLIAADRLYVPISSMDGKLKRQRKELAQAVDMPGKNFNGERVYARLVDEEGKKARGMSEAIKIFCEKHPNYGAELKGLVAEQRTVSEPTLYFGMTEGSRLTSDDYMQVMTDLGFTPAKAENMYQELMTASRKISRARGEERSILVG